MYKARFSGAFTHYKVTWGALTPQPPYKNKWGVKIFVCLFNTLG